MAKPEDFLISECWPPMPPEVRSTGPESDVQVFPCGLMISDKLIEQIEPYAVGLINAVHIVHHKRGHPQQPWGVMTEAIDHAHIRGWCCNDSRSIVVGKQ